MYCEGGSVQQHSLAGSMYSTQMCSIISFALLHFFLKSQLELINVQPRDCVVCPNTLKSQDMSGRSPCAPLAGHRVNKCKSCAGSAPQLCTLGLIVGFIITPRDAKPGSLEKKRQLLFRTISWLVLHADVVV